MFAIPWWTAAILVVAVLQIIGGLAGWVLSQPPVPPGTGVGPPSFINGINILAYGSAAALLVIGGRRDRRAVYLGTSLLLVAVAFSRRLTANLGFTAGPP